MEIRPVYLYAGIFQTMNGLCVRMAKVIVLTNADDGELGPDGIQKGIVCCDGGTVMTDLEYGRTYVLPGDPESLFRYCFGVSHEKKGGIAVNNTDDQGSVVIGHIGFVIGEKRDLRRTERKG